MRIRGDSCDRSRTSCRDCFRRRLRARSHRLPMRNRDERSQHHDAVPNIRVRYRLSLRVSAYHEREPHTQSSGARPRSSCCADFARAGTERTRPVSRTCLPRTRTRSADRLFARNIQLLARVGRCKKGWQRASPFGSSASSGSVPAPNCVRIREHNLGPHPAKSCRSG